MNKSDLINSIKEKQTIIKSKGTEVFDKYNREEANFRHENKIKYVNYENLRALDLKILQYFINNFIGNNNI